MDERTDIAVGTQSDPTVAVLRSQYAWWALVVASMALVTIAYLPVMHFWWKFWWADESLYSHGVLVPLISGFIVYMDRDRLSRIPIRPNLALGIGAFILVMVLALMFRMGAVISMEGFMFPLFLMASVILLMGTQMFRALLFPLAFLFFMCPMPGFLLSSVNVRIQIWSTIVAVKTLHLLQFDVANIGTTIMMPNAVITVGAPCSGFRMLISLFAFSSFFAFMKEGPAWGRVGTVMAAIPLSLITNATRVTLIALVGEFYGDEAMHAFHDWSGYIMLVVSFITLELISRLLGCKKFRLMQ